MKLISEAIKQKEKQEMKALFESCSSRRMENEEYADTLDDNEGIFQTVDDESGKDVFIEYGYDDDGEYHVYGMSWKREGPFVEVDPTSGWIDFAMEELEKNDPANPKKQREPGARFNFDYDPAELRAYRREEADMGNI